MDRAKSTFSLGSPAIAPVLAAIARLAEDRHVFGSITLKFAGPQGLTYITTERGQRPSELLEVANDQR